MATKGKSPRNTVVSEFEGTLLHSLDTFPYFMLVAFESSGLHRFTILLLLWPVLRLLRLAGKGELALKLTVFVAVAGVRMSELKVVARAVLPKFFMDGTDVETWRVFHGYERKVVLTKCPSIMVDWFAREHLGADMLIGGELKVNRFGYATGFMVGASDSTEIKANEEVVGKEKADMWLGREGIFGFPSMAACKDRKHGPLFKVGGPKLNELDQPNPVIFHDGRLVPLPTPLTALLIILWIPLGIILAVIRIAIGLLLPFWAIPYARRVFGGEVTIKGCPPVGGSKDGGVLFVCTHRSVMDPLILAAVLRRRVPAVTYSIARLTEILSPIPTIRLSRKRDDDADAIRRELSRGDLAICPEGTTCREPFLLRFSALFAELTHRIVPVAMNYRVGVFHATTARGWKGLDPIMYFMNPRPGYDVIFLEQLKREDTCAGGKSSHDVANKVQHLLAEALGFKCTNFTRKDKYMILSGNDGTVKSRRRFFSGYSSLAISASAPHMLKRARELIWG